MADSNVNIRITTDDKALQDLVKRLNAGTISVKEYNKEVRNLRDAAIVGSKAQMDLKKVVEQVGDATATANGKMMKSYFSTGEKLRQFYMEQRVGDRTMREAGQAVTGFASLLGGSNSGLGQVVGQVTARFQEAEFAATGLGIASQNAGGKIAGIGTVLMQNADLIAGAAAAIGGLAWAFNQAAVAAERYKRSRDALRSANYASGKLSKEDQVADITRRINEIQSAPFEGPSIMARLGGAYAIQQERLTQIFEREAKILALVAERNKLEEDIAKSNEKQVQSKQKMIEVAGSTVVGRRPAMQKIGLPGAKTDRVMQKVAAGEEVPIEVSFDDADAGWLAFSSSMSAGISSMSNMIGSQIGGAFARVFGGAQTALGSFMSSFTSTLAQIGISAVARLGIGSLFPALIPFLADGGPVDRGRPYIVGERGPELFVPNRSGEVVSNAKASRFGAMAMAGGPIVLETRIRGNDLVLVQAKASQSRRGRTM